MPSVFRRPRIFGNTQFADIYLLSDKTTTAICRIENPSNFRFRRSIFCDISVNLYQATRCHIKQGSITLNSCFENIRPHRNVIVAIGNDVAEDPVPIDFIKSEKYV
jgi:hypothetical protein